MPGELIVLEGIDGAGTTTQVRALEGVIPNTISTRQPTGGPIGHLLRDFLKGNRGIPMAAMACLFTADRLDHCVDIKKKLADGYNVLCDRFTWSTIAYQSLGMHDRELPYDMDWLLAISEPVITPSLILYLDCEPAIALARVHTRGQTKESYENAEHLKHCTAVYRALCGSSEDREELAVSVDGAQAPDLVTTDCVRIINTHLPTLLA